MVLTDLINMALTRRYTNKFGNQVVIKPDYKIQGESLRILTPVQPYQLVVLRRLLYAAHIKLDNIIVGYPND